MTVAATSAASADDGAAEFRQVVVPFLRTHCFACHGPETQEARIRYDQLGGYRPQESHLWTLVHAQLAAESMPPDGLPAAAAADRRRILAWIERQQQSSRPGGTRRLNRRELSAALRDLTGLGVDFTLGLPEDGKVDGFDTYAEGLQDTADSLAQTMLVMRRAVAAIRFREPASDQAYLLDPRKVRIVQKPFDRWNRVGVRTSTDAVCEPEIGLILRPKWVGDRVGVVISAPLIQQPHGVLRLRLAASARKTHPQAPNPHLWVEIGGRLIDVVEITALADRPHTLQFEIHLDDTALTRDHIEVQLCNRVEVPYAVDGFENEAATNRGAPIPGAVRLFRPQYDHKLTPWNQQPVPLIVVHELELDRDYRAAWPPATWNAAADSEDGDPKTARRLLGLWIDRAWRRPVDAAEHRPFVELYENLRAQGHTFDDALRAAFQAVLMSASFRYLPPVAETGDHALASRLSFLLWGAPPDAELRAAAASGKLREPAVLHAQIDRLLDDPRSAGFFRPFVTQWLEMDQPITIATEYLHQPDFHFSRYLRESMRSETISYVAQLIAGNRPARELVSSDTTMMNDILARHYGYQGVEGGRLREVRLRKDDPRGGGILGHAGIQSMLCWMGENWVIYRGAWTLRHILNDPPPPPPLEVPELIPSEPANHGKPFKELLEQHQADAKCALCHKTIDPLGFAFQNFDISGRWRETEFDHYAKRDTNGMFEWRGEGAARPVDTVGQLPRGESFGSFRECRELIVQNYLPDLARGLAENLVLYSAGRRPNVADRAQIDSILAELQTDGFPLRDLLHAILGSELFLNQPASPAQP